MVIYFKPIFILHNYLFYININTNGAFSMAPCFHFYISGHYNLFCSGLIIYQFSFSAHEPLTDLVREIGEIVTSCLLEKKPDLIPLNSIPM